MRWKHLRALRERKVSCCLFDLALRRCEAKSFHENLALMSKEGKVEEEKLELFEALKTGQVTHLSLRHYLKQSIESSLINFNYLNSFLTASPSSFQLVTLQSSLTPPKTCFALHCFSFSFTAIVD